MDETFLHPPPSTKKFEMDPNLHGPTGTELPAAVFPKSGHPWPALEVFCFHTFHFGHHYSNINISDLK